MQAGASRNIQIPVRVLGFAEPPCPFALRCSGWKSILWTARQPITNAITFTPAPGLLTSNTLTYGGSPNMYGTAFLDLGGASVSADKGIIGTSYSVTLPA